MRTELFPIANGKFEFVIFSFLSERTWKHLRILLKDNVLTICPVFLRGMFFFSFLQGDDFSKDLPGGGKQGQE